MTGKTEIIHGEIIQVKFLMTVENSLIAPCGNNEYNVKQLYRYYIL